MIQLRKLTLALPFAFIAACSSNRSSGDTGTAAGSIATDSMTPRTDTNPKPGVANGTAIDTAKSTMDTSMKDSTMMDTTKKNSTHHRRAKAKAKKPY